MTRQLSSWLAGFLFAIGLALSGMTQPGKVLGFLDVAGRWDASLLLVMFAAIAVYAAAYGWGRRLSKPISGDGFALPSSSRIDLRLVMGSVLFGIGWGLAGYCPGPAIVSVGAGSASALVFAVSMAAGFWAMKRRDVRI